MTMPWTGLALAVLLQVAAALPAQAESSLRICNRSTERSMTVAVLFQQDPFYPVSQIWHIFGWTALGPGNCTDAASAYGGTIAYISPIDSSVRDRPKVMHYPLYEGEMPYDKPIGVETFFCVKSDGFERHEASRAAHQSCPSGWYLQLFSLFIYVGKDTDFTLNLGN
ncbi:hypothetical protein [Pseudomonas jinjuensis]|uniref:Uncharacterized protein n=1 Tax=Pseudomonas jinjuensis TaxID=198616 RepID=A0A1H0NFU6_9PSED|nr:hypothetical protein [Pseudomonas jinjuensis]SDO91265.1 hypothetical protein SAMN05216193_11818 [Pseudomonas jinjuensis]